ncbi:MAG: hypothetical protein MR266_02770 [Erysipelotrichaceae bacterium]|nr:hypothetical protein [Erysipelotrichaceae bacterium]
MTLKIKNILFSYVLPITCSILMMPVLKVMFMFLFQVGRQYGTFLRNIFEISCNMV